MSSPRTTPHLHERPGDAGPAIDQRPASPWLWVALIATLLLAASWWLQQRASAPVAEIESPPSATVPAIETPAPAPRTGSAAVSRKQTTVPRVITRDATPLASNVSPLYPREALRAGVEGSVVARINVDNFGNVSDVAIVKREGNRDRNLDRAVLEAVRKWRFAPAMREGRAIASVVQVPVDFRSER